MTASSQRLRTKAYKFMIEHRAAALATAGKNNVPHVAIVYCMVYEDLSIYISSRVEGRKYQNLVNNPTIGMTFYSEADMQTIQLTGTAERVGKIECEQEILYELIKLRYKEPNWIVPPLRLFERGATNELAIIKITPNEMTFADFKITKNGRYRPVFQEII